MRGILKSKALWATGSMVGVFSATVVPAFAAAGDPPTFDVTSLGPKLNDYASALMTGSIALLGVVLIAVVPFVLIKLATRYVRKWFGTAKASAAA